MDKQVFKIRCFIALTLNGAALKKRLITLQKLLNVPGVNVLPSDKLHITLKFLGELTEREVNHIIKKLSKIDFPCFEIAVRGVGVFPTLKSPRIFWVGIKSKKLMELTNIIYQILELKCDFKSHITLARIKKQNSEILEIISNNLKRFEDCEFGKYLTKEIKLIKSELTPDGPIYSTIYKVNLN